ncbi:MAG: hypothetical protein AABX11_06370 [Nanoarchaeota archaeon]
MSDEQILVNFKSKEGVGPRKATYSIGNLEAEPYNRREFELYVVPCVKNVGDAGTIVGEITYLCREMSMSGYRRFFNLSPKNVMLGRVDLENRVLVSNGDINCGEIIKEIIAEAERRKIPYDEQGIRQLIMPIAQDYLRFNQKLQEYFLQESEKRGQQSIADGHKKGLHVVKIG